MLPLPAGPCQDDDDDGDDDPAGHDHLPHMIMLLFDKVVTDSFCRERAIVQGFMADIKPVQCTGRYQMV